MKIYKSNLPTIWAILFIILNFLNGCVKEEAPKLSIVEILSINQTSLTCDNEIFSDGGLSIVECGVCYSTSLNPTIQDNKMNSKSTENVYTITISGLLPNTTYHLRSFASNSAGTGYGEEVSIKTTELEPGTINDIDGNIYRTVKIGNQVWLAENLKTTHYNDGTPIQNVLNSTMWGDLTSGAYVAYELDNDYKDSYGLLYNWYAMDNSKGICPEGWHIPSKSEWWELLNYMAIEYQLEWVTFPENSQNVGCALRSCWQENYPLGGDCSKNEHPRWDFNNSYKVYGTDLVGFSALPGGYRYINGTFYEIGIKANWWSSTLPQFGSNTGTIWEIYYKEGRLSDFSCFKTEGHSIRCIKDSD